MLIGGKFFPSDAPWLRLVRCILFFGAIALLLICMLGMHSISSGHGTQSAAVGDASMVAAVDSYGDSMACSDCGEHGSDGGLIVLCGMVLIAVFGLVLTRPVGGYFLSRLRRLLLRSVHPRSPASHLTPSLIYLSISRT